MLWLDEIEGRSPAAILARPAQSGYQGGDNIANLGQQ